MHVSYYPVALMRTALQHHIFSDYCRIDVVTKEDALDFLQAEENKQKTNE